MQYVRLPFQQYFIDVSQNYHKTDKVHSKINYFRISYKHRNHTHNAYYRLHYDATRDVIQVFLKETADKTGWKANFEFAENYYDEFEYEGKKIQLRCHEGWSKMYQALKHYIRDEYEILKGKYPNAELEIIGWSLGSGLAQICAQDLYFNFGVKAHVFTYGSVKPWCGRNKLMKKYLSECYKECYNFAAVNDIVTYMPCLPRYFALNRVTVKLKKFCFFRLFNPYKYHTCYNEEKLYINIK